MDELGLRTLRDELLADCRVAEHAFQLARSRFDEHSDSGLEGCAHHLTRLYNVVEQMALRIASVFEHKIEDDAGWHAELIRRMAIAIQGIRPAFFPERLQQPLRELRGFRHVFTHAYDLELDREKLSLLLKYASQIAPALAGLCGDFVRRVAQQEGIQTID